MWSIHKVSGGKKCSGMVERRLCLAEDHLLGIFLTGSLHSRHWIWHRGKNNPCPPGLHHPEEEEDSPATPISCAKKGQTRRTPRDTNQARQEHCCLSIIRKTKILSTGQHTLLQRSCTQKKWELDKKDPCLRSLTEPWLTPNPCIWNPNKLHSVRRRGTGRGSFRGRSPDQTCSHHWTAGWLSVLWWSSPWLSYSDEVPEVRKRYKELDCQCDTKSILEHSKMECVFMGSWAVLGQRGWPQTAGL